MRGHQPDSLSLTFSLEGESDMDIIEFVSSILGRKLYAIEERMIQAILQARQRGDDPKSMRLYKTSAEGVAYKKVAPIVDRYFQEQANA